VVSGINGTYDASKQSGFTLFLDAETAVGCAVQVRVSYDFTGNGTWDRFELFSYFPTNASVDWEAFQSGAFQSATGSFANLSGGKVRVELWNALGNGPVKLRTGAPAADANVSRIALPFT
jgi:hypothetical protein